MSELTAQDAPQPAPNEPVAHYGARCLRFVLEHGAYAVGFLSDDACTLAHYACHRALATRMDLGTKESPDKSPATVYDRIEDARRLLRASVADRENAAEMRELLAALEKTGTPTPDSDRPNLGPMAKLIKPPTPQPPAGDMARPPVPVPATIGAGHRPGKDFPF